MKKTTFDSSKKKSFQHSDQLLDLDAASASLPSEPEKSKHDSILDDVMIGLGSVEIPTDKSPEHHPVETETLIVHGLASSNVAASTVSSAKTLSTNGISNFSIDDLLSDTSETFSSPPLVLPTMSSTSTTASSTQMSAKFEEPKTSRVRGLDELNLV
jgi:hypothetical protein